MSKKRKKKIPLPAITPSEKKIPKVHQNPNSFRSQRPSWRVSLLDVDGPWGIQKVTKEYFIEKILPKLQDFETMYWNEILNANSHEISRNKIIKAAQERLEQLTTTDFDNLVSLRLKGKERIWGIRERNILKILWWDSEHEICPSKKKHT